MGTTEFSVSSVLHLTALMHIPPLSYPLGSLVALVLNSHKRK